MNEYSVKINKFCVVFFFFVWLVVAGEAQVLLINTNEGSFLFKCLSRPWRPDSESAWTQGAIINLIIFIIIHTCVSPTTCQHVFSVKGCLSGN